MEVKTKEELMADVDRLDSMIADLKARLVKSGALPDEAGEVSPRPKAKADKGPDHTRKRG